MPVRRLKRASVGFSAPDFIIDILKKWKLITLKRMIATSLFWDLLKWDFRFMHQIGANSYHIKLMGVSVCKEGVQNYPTFSALVS